MHRTRIKTSKNRIIHSSLFISYIRSSRPSTALNLIPLRLPVNGWIHSASCHYVYHVVLFCYYILIRLDIRNNNNAPSLSPGSMPDRPMYLVFQRYIYILYIYVRPLALLWIARGGFIQAQYIHTYP